MANPPDDSKLAEAVERLQAVTVGYPSIAADFRTLLDSWRQATVERHQYAVDAEDYLRKWNAEGAEVERLKAELAVEVARGDHAVEKWGKAEAELAAMHAGHAPCHGPEDCTVEEPVVCPSCGCWWRKGLDGAVRCSCCAELAEAKKENERLQADNLKSQRRRAKSKGWRERMRSAIKVRDAVLARAERAEAEVERLKTDITHADAIAAKNRMLYEQAEAALAEGKAAAERSWVRQRKRIEELSSLCAEREAALAAANKDLDELRRTLPEGHWREECYNARIELAAANERAEKLRQALERIHLVGCTLDEPEEEFFCRKDGSAHSVYCPASIAREALRPAAPPEEPK